MINEPRSFAPMQTWRAAPICLMSAKGGLQTFDMP